MHINDDLSPTGPAAFGVIAERFRRAGQPEKAAALCREGLDKFPDHLSARVTLGWSLLDMGEFQEAFDELKRVLKRAPDNLAAIRGLAELHEQGIGLVFESWESLDEPEAAAEPELIASPEDFDPIIEPDELDVPSPSFFDAPFELEDVIEAVEPESEPEPLPPPARLRLPVSLFERAPLALRDETDDERVGELHEWLTRIRDRKSEPVSQYMAG